MYAVQDEMETIHLYVVREQEKRPYTLLPLLCAALCLLGIATLTLYSAQHPYYEHAQLSIPAVVLPLKIFTARSPIIPTGMKTYPATTAHGILTLTNGSVLSEVLPTGIVFSSTSGIEVQTTASAFIPEGSAAGYGVATVPAKALIAGRGGNIATLAVDAVYGTALYVRNLAAFSGGKDSYSVSFVTPQDKQTAFTTARNLLATTVRVGYHYPCNELWSGNLLTIQLTLRCQFVAYNVPSYMHVVSAKLAGKKFIVDVTFIAPPVLVRTRFGIGH